MLAAINGPGHLTRRLHQAHARLWQDALCDEVTGPQFTVLGVLRTAGAMDQRMLGTHAPLDKSTAAPVIERLRRRGLVQIGQDSVDRRRKLVRITDEGNDLVRRLAPSAVEIGEALLAPLDAGERATLLELLHRIS